MGRLLVRVLHEAHHGDDGLFDGVIGLGAESGVGSSEHYAGAVAVGDAGFRPVGRGVSELGLAGGHGLAEGCCQTVKDNG